MTNLAVTGERFVEEEATGLRAFMERERCEAQDQ